MQKIRIAVGVITALAALSACNNPPANPGNDAGAVGTDSGHTDSATDTGPSDGGSSGGTCATPINLNTAGTAPASGTGRTLASSNATAPMAPMTGLANGTCADDGMGASTAVNEVVFQYTMQSGGYLVASTDDPATLATLDTIVWILDGCTAGATELACNDDVDLNAGNVFSTAMSMATVSAGTTVFIVVAGYNMPAMGGTSHGAFTLNVRELQPHAAGAACDATNMFCVDGYTCVYPTATATSGTCNANGTEYAPCNTSAPFCTGTTLVCSVAAPTAGTNGTCQTPIASAQPCTPGFHDVCVANNTCEIDAGSMTDGHCLVDGSDNGACRITGTPCDGTLACSNMTPVAGDTGVCQVPIASGGVCTLDHFVCVTGNTCIPDMGSTTMGHCLADGAMGGACRSATPMCDGTLTCDPNHHCN